MLGIALSHLGSSELNFHLLSQKHNVCFFVREFSPPCIPPASPTLHHSEMWGFNGAVIATDLSSAITLSKCPSPSKKLFYVWDLEWLNMTQKSFWTLAKAYSSLPLIARTDEHKALLEKSWGAKVVGVCPFANISQLSQFS